MVLTKKVKRKIAAAFTLAALSFGPAAFAQEATPDQNQEQQSSQNISDEELQQFVKANAKASSLKKENQQEMISIIKEQGMEVARFNEIAQAHRQKKVEEMNISEEEMASFDKAAQQIMEMQPAAKKEVDDAIAAEGLTVERYEEIMAAYEQDPEIKASVQAILQQ